MEDRLLLELLVVETELANPQHCCSHTTQHLMDQKAQAKRATVAVPADVVVFAFAPVAVAVAVAVAAALVVAVPAVAGFGAFLEPHAHASPSVVPCDSCSCS